MTQTLAVYGTLKQNYWNHSVLGKDAKLIGAGKTKDSFYMEGRGVPVVYKTPVAPVAVEVYEVSDDRLTGPLDTLESNGLYYNREKTTIALADGSETEAWLYFGMDERGPREGEDTTLPEGKDHFSWPFDRN